MDNNQPGSYPPPPPPPPGGYPPPPPGSYPPPPPGGYPVQYEQPNLYGYDDYERQRFRLAESAAKTSMVCGIIGLFVAGLILGIVAIVQSVKAKNLGYNGGMQAAGLVLGIIAIIGNIGGTIIFLFMLGNLNLFY